METFKSIDGISGCLISDKGRIFSTIRNKFLGHKCNKSGYVRVSIVRDGKRSLVGAHRLIAEAFIDNPENKRCVNHIDGNKSNNNASNLEWVTHKENTAHAIKNGLWIPRYGSNGREKGFKHTEETKRKMSEKKKGNNHPKFRGYIHTPYGVFESTYAAGLAEGVSHTCISYRCKSPKRPLYYKSYHR